MNCVMSEDEFGKMFTAMSVRCVLILVIVNLKVAECHSDSSKDCCYEFMKEKKTWKDARNACKDKRGDLVSIETEEEWDFIKGMIQTQTAKTWFIGLEKRAGSWTWVSGRPLTICNWKKDKQAGNGSVARLHKKNCTFLHGGGKRNRSFICETAKGIGENTSQGYCYKPVAIPCKLEYDKKNWTQTCIFSAYYCSMSCTVRACEPSSVNWSSEEFCGQKCTKTFNPLVQQCTDDKHVNSTYNQTCNATKCNLTEGERNFSTRNTCYCEDDECSKPCSDLKCTQTGRGRENATVPALSVSTGTQPLSSLPLISATPNTPSRSPSPSSSSSQSIPTATPSSSLTSRTISKLANEYRSKLERINLNEKASLQNAMRIFEHFATSIENITELPDGKSDEDEVGERRESIFKVAVILEEIALNYGKHHLIGTNQSKWIDSQKLVLMITKTSRQNASGFNLQKEEWKQSINISSANFADYGQVVVGFVYKDLHQLLQLKHPIKERTGITRDVGSRIMAVAMDPKPEMRENVILKFRNLEEVEGRKVCAFWSGFRERSASNGFSEEGCHLVTSERNSEEIICSCNHLTHFAVLVDYNSDLKLTEEDETILEIITYVGLSLSIIGILLTIILYSFLTDVRQPLSQIRLSLSVSLGAGQMIFLAGINATENTVACVTAAVFMQYFLMAAFFWMLVEGVYLYLFVVKVYNITEKMHMYHVMSWGLPIIVIGISLCIAAGKGGLQSYTSDRYCWLSHTNNLVWIFISFVVFIEVLNILILVRVIREMTTLVQPTGEYNHIQQIRLGIRTCAVMVPLLGVTWLFGLLLPMHKAIAYIFTIFNSTQGFLIFAFHCVRNSQIRERFKRKMNTIFPSTVDHGNSIKKSTQINPSGASDMWAVELQSFNE